MKIRKSIFDNRQYSIVDNKSTENYLEFVYCTVFILFEYVLYNKYFSLFTDKRKIPLL